ncbi:MAG: CapA family protein [Armatimonadota bacterium]|nr:MAG: CapA family protein [Armatimonadota bacterium]
MAARETVTLGATGDISFSGQTGVEMMERGADWPFESMRPHLARADVLFGNMESVAIPDDYPRDQIDPDGLISPVPGPDGAAALKRAGFDFLNLAANHILDAGAVGMDYTKRCLEQAGIATGGVGYSQAEARRLAVLETGGLTFGFLCYGEDSNYTLGHTTPSYAYYELDTVVEDVRRHRADADVLVVSIHGDLEFMPTPSLPRLCNSREIARAGADLILQHHPHVPQGMEMVDGCLIAYSLGNFVFDAHSFGYLRDNGPHTAHSFLLLAEVGRNGVESFERVPFEIRESPEERPVALEGRARGAMLRYLSRLDAKLADEEAVKRTWRKVAKRMLKSYIQKAAERDVDGVIEELVGRVCFVAENRSWAQEIRDMAREQWDQMNREADPLHRPHYRFTRKRPRRRVRRRKS